MEMTPRAKYIKEITSKFQESLKVSNAQWIDRAEEALPPMPELDEFIAILMVTCKSIDCQDYFPEIASAAYSRFSDTHLLGTRPDLFII